MDYYSRTIDFAVKRLGANKERGLNGVTLQKNRAEYGLNKLTAKKKPKFISKLFAALKEPMLIILMVSFVIALGANIAKAITTGDGDFVECFGILAAIILSVSITLVMEGSSEKAFATLARIYDNVYVRVIRDGQTVMIAQQDVAVGDLILLESGDKIVADGRLIESNFLVVDESALTGESHTVNKSAEVVCQVNAPLAERVNMVYSGTFVTGGSGKMLVTAVGDKTEIGNIAVELKSNQNASSPLQHKLARLGKSISIIGALSALLVFVLSLVRLIVTNTVTFSSVQNLFISCIILIVAAVPEGLPTIVAVSLALNMIKLAKENALIKKMVATETAGAVSVICSDKTGTLTMNKMSVVTVCTGEYCSSPKGRLSKALLQNFVCNSTANLSIAKNTVHRQGSGTECALLEAAIKTEKSFDYKRYRKQFAVQSTIPFSSQEKMMSTTIIDDGQTVELVKGAPEKVLDLCNLTSEQKAKILDKMSYHQKKARRVLCFAHRTDVTDKFIYDGFVALVDEIRRDVYSAVKECKRAGIGIKILTGDNAVTAFAVAKELRVATSLNQVINAVELERMTDSQLKTVLPRITVIARSTPLTKLKIVKALQEMGEVVAVTGDGINDAPAIKRADVGFAMGNSGSEISKEAADAVLLDDSFATIVKAIAFGRNVYRNLQRFIIFQLSVNISALIFITFCAIVGVPSPFNTLQLLWINVIMDGPPALTLGLETGDQGVMSLKPIKRSQGIVSLKMMLRIAFNGVFISTVLILQNTFNFLGVSQNEKTGSVFTLFILFQLFNAFNSRGFGAESIFKSISKNKLMLYTFAFTFLIQVLIMQFAYKLFGVNGLCFVTWIKVFLTSFSIIVISEIYKLIYRLLRKKGLLVRKK